MADRRSGRTKKTVDYSKFAGGESDNDDDFRDSSTQPSKRKKTESVSPKSVKVKLKKIDEISYKIETKKSEKEPKKGEDDETKKRPSLSDKVFQRHLSEALEISKQNTPLDRNGENESSLLLSDHESVKSSQGEKTEDKPSLPSEGSTVTENHSSCKEAEVKENRTKDKDSEWKGVSSSESDVECDSDWSDDNEEENVKKPAVKNSRSSRKKQSDESDWSDDDVKKKSKKPPAKKGVTKQQTRTLISPKASRSPAPTSLKCSKPSRQTPRHNPVSPASKPRIKNCASPCQVISSPVKLPPKGLRLGLSRKVPSKPLHSVIKVQH